MEDEVEKIVLVRFNQEHNYMKKHRPGARVDLETGEMQGLEAMGEGPFEARETFFTHGPKLPAILIKLSGGGWSRPMSPALFEECED